MPHRSGNDTFCELETITMVPISRNLIDTNVLTEYEIQWVNKYHENVRERLTPLLTSNEDALMYLKRETSPL